MHIVGIIFGVLVGAFVLAVAVVVVVGLRLPADHVATREAAFTRPPEMLFATITDVAKYAEWRKDVKRVDKLPDRGGKAAWREIGGFGVITFEEVESDEPKKHVTRIADPDLPFAGTWTYELAPADKGGTRLRITERGEVKNPLFRFMSRYVFGQTKTIEDYLVALGEKFGERVKPVA